MYHFFIYTLILLEGIAAAVSIFYLKKNKQLRLFSFYLLFIFFSELLGLITQHFHWDTFNQVYFDFFVIPIEFIFFYWFYLSLKKVKLKAFFMYSGTYLFLLTLDYIKFTPYKFLSISYMFGSIFLFLIVFNYLFQFIMSGDIINFKTNPFIYISIGLLIFYIGSFPFYGLKNYLWDNFKLIGNNYWYVANTLNCIMYCMFTISFLCNRQKSISPSY